LVGWHDRIEPLDEVMDALAVCVGIGFERNPITFLVQR